MQIMNMLSLALSGATATGTAASGTTGTNASAAGTSEGFGQLLVQALSGSLEGEEASVANPLAGLAELLAELAAGLGDGEVEVEEQAMAPELWSLLVSKLSEEPELLDKLLGDDDMQDWLVQAALLMQGMQQLPTGWVKENLPALDEESSVAEAETGEAGGLDRRQAQEVLQAFSQALQSRQDPVFTAQLQEKLAVILAKQPEFSAAVAEGEVKADSGQGDVAHVVQDVKPAARSEESAARSSFGESKSDSKGAQAESRNTSPELKAYLESKLQSTVSASNSTRLEMLAAKSMTVNVSELLKGFEEAPALQSDQTDAEQLQAVLPQDNSRFTAVKTLLPTEAVVNSNNLVEDLSEFMLGKLRLQTGNGLMEARLTLTPESLGQVDVKLSLHNGQLVAHFAAQTAMGKDALEAQLSQLRAALQAQGIQVEKIEVTQSPALQSSMFQDQRGQRQFQQFARDNEDKGSHDGGGEEYASEAMAILNGRKDLELEQEGFDAIV